MADYVVDTNVWVMVDKPIAALESVTEINCVQACQQWLNNFITSQDRLVVDLDYRIIREYRRNIPQGGSAYQMLAILETTPRERLIELPIEYDNHGYAKLPFETIDPEDRKFVAVALAHNPLPPIVNATDTHWAQDKEILASAGITVQELCHEYVQQKLNP